MTDGRDHQPRIEFPSELEVSVTQDFAAPIGLVFDVLTQAEHMRETFAPFDETVTLFEHDFRVGGEYHYVMVTPEGDECSFRGTFREIDAPHKSVQTWHFDGWPDADAVETLALRANGDTTTFTWTLAFSDLCGRGHMRRYDGILANVDNIAGLLDDLMTRSEAPVEPAAVAPAARPTGGRPVGQALSARPWPRARSTSGQHVGTVTAGDAA